MTVRVIRAEPVHLDVLTGLFDGYRQFYRQPSDLERARAFLAQRLARADSVIFVAFGEDGAACGFTQLYPSFSSVRAQRTWILNDLFVDPGRRQHGAGRALLEAAHAYAAETGAAAVTLSTEHTNEPAKALYRAMGYAPVTAFAQYSLRLPEDGSSAKT